MDPYSATLNKINERGQAIVPLLVEWADMNSGSENLPGLKVMTAALEIAFSSLGGTIELLTLPALKRLSIHDKETDIQLGKVLSVTKNPDAPTQILLAGHMDIAFPAEHPLERNATLEGNILYGRGTSDMKGGIAVMLLALQALEESPFAGRIGWRVLITPDEELGSPGSHVLLREIAKNYSLGLVFEPTLPDGSLVSERKGSANYSVVITGKAAHAGRDFHEGRNALTTAARFALAAERLTDIEAETTVNIGLLEGGGSINIVPDKAFCRLNIRVKDNVELERVKGKLRTLADAENNREGISLVLHQDGERPPKILDNTTTALFEALRSNATALGMDLKLKSSGGVCDGNTLAAAGLPTIDTLGVVGGNIHTAEEYMVLDSLIERAKLTARFLMQIAEGKVNI